MNNEVERTYHMGDQNYRLQLPINRGYLAVYDDFYSSDSLNIRDRLFQIEYMMEQGIYKGGDKWLTLDIINCFGGSVEAALASYDFLLMFCKKHDMKLRVRVFGACYSSAAMILLQAGHDRVCSPHSSFLLHEPRQFVMDSERVSDMIDRHNGIEYLSNLIYSIMSERSGRPVEEIREDIERRELWLSPAEMQERNLLDRLLE